VDAVFRALLVFLLPLVLLFLLVLILVASSALACPATLTARPATIGAAQQRRSRHGGSRRRLPNLHRGRRGRWQGPTAFSPARFAGRCRCCRCPRCCYCCHRRCCCLRRRCYCCSRNPFFPMATACCPPRFFRCPLRLPRGSSGTSTSWWRCHACIRRRCWLDCGGGRPTPARDPRHRALKRGIDLWRNHHRLPACMHAA